MGYYSDDEEQKSNKGNGWLMPIVIALAVGILLVLVISPSLMGQNDREDQGDQPKEQVDDTEKAEKDEKKPAEKQPINVDVATQITDIVERVSPAVVGVTNLQTRADFWQENESTSEAGTGSGVIYKIEDKYAYIVTNHHVVENADNLEIVLHDDTSLEAELLGSDLFTDLAVLRVESKGIDTAIELGRSDNLKVGEPAIAIGNPLGHMFAGSVTQGIISGKMRTIPQDFNQDGRPDWQAEVIQTDAAINPGNSGGALINIEGQLIGINSMKISQDIAQGIGFAIPIDIAKPIIDELEETGIVKRAYLGVELYSLDEVPKTEWENTLKLPEEVEGGVYLWSVEPFSPAEEAGLKRLDVITSFNGKPVLNILDLRKELYQELKSGDKTDIEYYRNGQKQETTVTLTEQK